ncbi:MAG: hypothetical protein HOF77_03280 [Actinobacteria bacterium]|jgi:hypothetical protein|nr:hypothetical protein [Actinomycetota bacterium]
MKQHEDLIKKEIPKELIDQSAHFGSCLLLTIIGTIPIIGPIFLVWLWAITREYYQHKEDFLEPQENFFNLQFFNLDMKWSIAGIALGGCVSGILWYLLLTKFLWVGDSIVVKAFV